MIEAPLWDSSELDVDNHADRIANRWRRQAHARERREMILSSIVVKKYRFVHDICSQRNASTFKRLILLPLYIFTFYRCSRESRIFCESIARYENIHIAFCSLRKRRSLLQVSWMQTETDGARRKGWKTISPRPLFLSPRNNRLHFSATKRPPSSSSIK